MYFIYSNSGELGIVKSTDFNRISLLNSVLNCDIHLEGGGESYNPTGLILNGDDMFKSLGL